MPIKIRFAKAKSKPSALALLAYWTSLAACLIHSATIYTTLIATTINPEVTKSEDSGTLSSIIQIGIASATLASLAALVLAIIAISQPKHPRPRTHATVAACMSAIILTITAVMFLFALA